jgi:hypothetical protein
MNTAAKPQIRSALVLFVTLSIFSANAQGSPPIESLGPDAPQGNVVPLPTEPGLVYLSSLKPDLVKRHNCGAELIGKYSVFLGGQRVGGEHSLSLHPLGHNGYAAVRFSLDKTYDGLVGAYGFIDPEPRDGSSLFFAVKTNGRLLSRSVAITRQKPAGSFAVSLKGCTSVELWVELKGFFEGTHAGWIEPLLVPKDFDLAQATKSLRDDAEAVPKTKRQDFFRRAVLLEQIATVRNEPKALNEITQARKKAIFRVGAP